MTCREETKCYYVPKKCQYRSRFMPQSIQCIWPASFYLCQEGEWNSEPTYRQVNDVIYLHWTLLYPCRDTKRVFLETGKVGEVCAYLVYIIFWQQQYIHKNLQNTMPKPKKTIHQTCNMDISGGENFKLWCKLIQYTMTLWREWHTRWV